MHLEDLQTLVLGAVDRDEVKGVLWDPMPGGSGLLAQMLQEFPRVVAVASEMLLGCPSACDTSCNDCLQTFRNGFYHRYLNRHCALDWIGTPGNALVSSHEIPACQAAQSTIKSGMPVNDAEAKLKHLLVSAGFTAGTFQQQVRFRHTLTLGHQIGSSTPDVFFEGDEDDPDDRGICIYLDGLSAHLHGNALTSEVDNRIRDWLRANGYHVLYISYAELSERETMKAVFKKLAKYLSGRDLANKIVEDTSWFDQASGNS